MRYCTRVVYFHREKCRKLFLIIDDKEGYLIGASIKDAGKKSFAITKIEDVNMVRDLIKKMGNRNINLK